jgi:DNA polymerase-3 subunit gamma/tau
VAYLVLARKYRPDTFAGVVGQEPVARTLANALRTGRLAHAYLFTGPRGVGKTSMARILARALQCERGPTDQPCGECARCRGIAAGSDLDVIEIDGASNRGIESIRDLRESVRYAPTGGRYKVYIVDEVHQITHDAFNAFLKTLEEPPEHVVFVFATTEPGKVPETIRSRCQEFEFRRIPEAVIAAHLRELCTREDFELEEGMDREIARRARGGLRDALSLLDQLAAYGEGRVTFQGFQELTGFLAPDRIRPLFDAVVARDLVAALEWVETALERGASAADLIDQVLEYARTLLHHRAGSGRCPSLPGVAPERVAAQVRALDEGQILGLLQALLHARRALRDLDDSRLAIEMLAVEFVRIAELPALDGLLRGLEDGEDPAAARSSRAGTGARAPRDTPVPAEPPAPPPRRAANPSGPTPAPARQEPTPPGRSASAGESTRDAAPAPRSAAAVLQGLIAEARRHSPSLLPLLGRLEALRTEGSILWVGSRSEGSGADLESDRLRRFVREWGIGNLGTSLVLRLEGKRESEAPANQERRNELEEIQRRFGGDTVSD